MAAPRFRADCGFHPGIRVGLPHGQGDCRRAPGAKDFRGRARRSRHRPHRGARSEDQCRGGARLRPRPRCREGRRRRARPRRAPAAARTAVDDQGIVQRRRPADDLGHSGGQGFCAAGRRAHRRPPQGRRRRCPRQDQRAADARRLAELQRHLRHYQQSMGPRPHAGRLLRRLRGGAGRRVRAVVARLGYRRLVARAGELLRRLPAQTFGRHHPRARASAARRPGDTA
jgi:hypothetical protein